MIGENGENPKYVRACNSIQLAMFRMSAGSKIDNGISISKLCGRDGELLLSSA